MLWFPWSETLVSLRHRKPLIETYTVLMFTALRTLCCAMAYMKNIKWLWRLENWTVRNNLCEVWLETVCYTFWPNPSSCLIWNADMSKTNNLAKKSNEQNDFCSVAAGQQSQQDSFVTWSSSSCWSEPCKPCLCIKQYVLFMCCCRYLHCAYHWLHSLTEVGFSFKEFGVI